LKPGSALRPKRPLNFQLTLVACLLVVAAHGAASYRWPVSPKRGAGLVFGVLAAALFVFEMSYPSRRPRARPLGTAQAWIQAHIYLGVVAFCAVLAHSGFAWPHGTLGWLLLLLSSWTVLSGLAGVWLQKVVPAILAEGLEVEAIYERIPGLVGRLLAESDALVVDAGDVLERFYRNEVRPSLAGVHGSMSFLLDVRGGRDHALEPFRRVLRFVDEREKAIVEDLMAIYQEKRELDAQFSLQGLLRGWTLLHVPAAGLLMGLTAMHIVSWILY
jgi:hypothetical protein